MPAVRLCGAGDCDRDRGACRRRPDAPDAPALSMGRHARAEAASTPLPIRVSPEERARIARAALVNRQSVSAFARDALVTAADDCLEDGDLKSTRNTIASTSR